MEDNRTHRIVNRLKNLVTMNVGSINIYNSKSSDLRMIFFLFLSTRISFFLSFFLILFYYQHFGNVVYEFGNVYLTYDGIHYYNIAINGYTEEYQYAFFPLFPLIIRFFSIFGFAVPATILFNHVLTLASAYLLYFTSMNIMYKSSELSLFISKLWIFSPIMISTCVLYSEALFVFLTLASYYLYKKQRFFYAGILLGLAVATRNTGSMLFFSIFIIMLATLLTNKDRIWFKNICIMYIPATFISCLYPIYLQIKLGNWHYFIDVQYEHWSKAKTNFLIVVSEDLRMFSDEPFSFIFTYISLAIFFWILYHAVKEKKYYELILYSILSLIAIFSTSRTAGANIPSTSYYRYFFGLFPLYLLINQYSNKRIILLISMFMSVIATVFYCAGGFLI